MRSTGEIGRRGAVREPEPEGVLNRQSSPICASPDRQSREPSSAGKCRSASLGKWFRYWAFQEPDGLAVRDRGTVVSEPVDAPKHADHDCGTGCGTPALRKPRWNTGSHVLVPKTVVFDTRQKRGP